MPKDNRMTGQRLAECLELRKTTQANLRKELFKREGYEVINRQNLNGAIRRGAPISDDKLIMIADILNVHSGYLIGDDNYICKTYPEYQDFKKLFTDPNFEKYNNAVRFAGLMLTVALEPYGENYEYSITRIDGKTSITKEFSAASIELFYKRIIEAINTLFDDYTDEIPDSLENNNWSRYLKWHPNFFDYMDTDTKKRIKDILKGGDTHE